MYPSILLQYDVKNTYKDPYEIFPKLVKSFRDERLKNKHLFKETGDKRYTYMEQAQKIFINSLYGLLGAKGINFNDPAAAAFVTEKGREILQKSIKWATNGTLIRRDSEWIYEKGYDNTHDFTLVNADTDSISFCKKDQTIFTKEEQEKLIVELNKLLPEHIKFESEGLFKKVIITKAKNYLLVDENNKWIMKGAALKATTKEKRLRKLLRDMLNSMVEDKDNLLDLYNDAILEAMNLDSESIKEWVSKKTITDKVLNPKRTNEAKILDAIKGRQYNQGDKIYLFFKPDNSLCLVENFNGDYNKKTMIKKVWSTVQVFGNFIDTKEKFHNFTLKRNQQELKELCEKHGIKYSL
jgi:DNA polymerase elongation subunit (family B)